MPIKKKKNTKEKIYELTQEEKDFNKIQAQKRIIVEHSIGGLKRYKILYHRNRIKDTNGCDSFKMYNSF